MQAAYIGFQDRDLAKAKGWAARVRVKECALQDQSTRIILAEGHASGLQRHGAREQHGMHEAYTATKRWSTDNWPQLNESAFHVKVENIIEAVSGLSIAHCKSRIFQPRVL